MVSITLCLQFAKMISNLLNEYLYLNMSLNILFVFAILTADIVSGGEKYDVTFAENPRLEGENIKLNYTGNECVNVPSNWQNRIQSANIHNHCIRVYTQLNCKGRLTYFHRGYTDYSYLSAFDLEKKILSFKKCEPKLRFQVDARPHYGMTVTTSNGGHGARHVAYVTSGECHTLPKMWQVFGGTRSVVIPNSNCWVLYNGTDCTGTEKTMNPDIYGHDNLYGEDFKSVKPCTLEFHGECNPTPCPKYLQENSTEYEFWKLFFSIYSTRYLNQFEERVKNSKDGLISWDFLFAPNTAASSRGDQYLDAFQVLHLILFNLIETSPGKLKFKITDIGQLHDLAKLVRVERINQKSRPDRWNIRNHNDGVITHTAHLWKTTDRILGTLDGIWNAEIEEINGKLEHEVTFGDAQGTNVKFKYKGKECKDVPVAWRKRFVSANIHNHCVRAYTQLDCEGSPSYLHRGYQDYNFLSALDLENKIQSFKQCEPNVQFHSDARPRYRISVEGHVVDVVSGECQTLPQSIHNRVRSVIIPRTHCWVFYEGTGCTGYKIYMEWNLPSPDKFGLPFGGRIKSIKTCELEFRGGCDPAPCPKYLHRSSVEYAFWRYFFSIYSHTYRNIFEKRVKESSDGMISWDFLFAPNMSAASRGDQYSDAFEYLQLVLFTLVEGQPGTLKFNVDSIETLSDQVRIILEERHKHKHITKDDWTYQNNAIMIQTERLWQEIERILGTITRYWSPDKNDDLCGLVEPRETLTIPLISGGAEAFYGEDPWHAAIYTVAKKTLICGATIISQRALVSAAHCFFNEASELALNDTSDYEIYVAKLTRTYSKPDFGGKFQKTHKIQDLHFYTNGYNPILTMQYGSDIIVIILEEPLTFNKYVRPACIDWDGSIFNDLYDSQNNTGRVVGWGITTSGGIPDIRDASEQLLVANLPYMSYSVCVGKVNHLTGDKFCGGAQSGSSVQSGDSGGGFMFKYNGRYYLRGIVSTKDWESDSSIGTFTSIASYTSWLQQYV